ncbi:Phage small terminase subunit [Pseudomonas marincola]|uniref:Phage small terminase subunit n=1 Tax=Pseudomonas marincola TaxID=437900 RepID=A0A653EAJ8_9PSED|nr:phage terminase small subunit [Pseudomonas marincola]CAE6923143.1 Phage small terminase subunit [Pseudomonas marincola]
MALTLAQRTQLRTRAAKEAAATAPAATMDGANSYELQLAQLAQHRARLKQVQSNQGKAELKALLLPEYEPYVQGVLEAGNGAQDEVLTTLMLWRIDAADYPGALEIADYVIRHNMKMPDRFERTTGTLIAEEIAEAALKAQKAGDSFPLDVLERAAQVTVEQDMPDQARAKLHLAIGKAYAALVDADAPAELDPIHLQAAQVHLSRAIDLHSNCGGKKDLERVDRLLKKHAEPATPPAS